MEAEVEFDQRTDVTDLLGREMELAHALLGHARTDHLVMVERDAVGPEPARRRLADVVQQSGEPQIEVGLAVDDGSHQILHHGERMTVDVLVPMDRVLLEPQRGELWEELLGELGLDGEVETLRRMRRRDDLDELVADPLARHDLQALVLRAHRIHKLGRRRHSELRDEPRRPEHPERVVG